jgi:alcohol dehydrogenase class IV
MARLLANIAFPTRYRFGWGRRTELAAEAQRAGFARPLVVTDPGVRAQPWMAPLLESLAGAVVFDGVSSNPTEAEVAAGTAAYAGCDGVIAIGGGAAMDAAKLIAPAPILAMPTTSGSGSELSIGAVVTDPVAKVKRTVLQPRLMPRAVIADPEVTVGLPAHVTAATGLDALTHAIEALHVPAYHPMCDAIAREAIEMVFEHLPCAVREPGHVEARSHLMMASSMAAVAFQKGLGLVHAMAHPLGATTNVHHGLANAVLLPHVLELNAPAIAAACARIGGTVAATVAKIRELARTVRIPDSLPAPDLPVEELARLALDEKLYLATNPRPVSADEVAGVYRRVFVAPGPTWAAS